MRKTWCYLIAEVHENLVTLKMYGYNISCWPGRTRGERRKTCRWTGLMSTSTNPSPLWSPAEIFKRVMENKSCRLRDSGFIDRRMQTWLRRCRTCTLGDHRRDSSCDELWKDSEGAGKMAQNGLTVQQQPAGRGHIISGANEFLTVYSLPDWNHMMLAQNHVGLMSWSISIHFGVGLVVCDWKC